MAKESTLSAASPFPATHRKRCCLGCLALLAGTAALAQAPVPERLRFQAYLARGGAPIRGTHDITFTVWNDPRSTDPADIVWSETRPRITVVNGHLDVVLGDPTTSSGTLDHLLFDDPERYLEVWIAADPRPISPRFRLVTSPYVFRTATVDGARGGTIRGSVEVSDQLLVQGIANVGGFKLTPGAERDAVLASDASGNGAWKSLSEIGWDGCWRLEGNSGTDHQVHSLGTTDSMTLVLRVDDRPAVRIRPPPMVPDFGISSGGESPSLIAGHEDNAVAAGVAGAIVAGGGWVVDEDTRINQVRSHFGTVGGGAGNLAGSDEETYYAMYATVSGGRSNRASGHNAVVGGGRGNVAKAIDATIGGGVDNQASGDAATVPGGSGNVASGDRSFAAGLKAHARHDGAFVWADSLGDAFYSQFDNEFRIRAHGGFTLARSDGRASFKIDTESVHDAGKLTLFSAAGEGTVELIAVDSDKGAEEGGRLNLFRGDGRRTITLDASEGPDQGSTIKLFNSAGAGDDRKPTIELDADYGESGRGRVITDVLEITGSDLAERFPVRSDDFPPSGEAAIDGDPSADMAGLVVSIDPKHPGQLVVSSVAYDTAVAGVISGAGGLGPGMLMGRQSVEAGGWAVALSGRAFAWADASTAPIRPGDLLTTSATPGHVMKVTDPSLAQGAIVGKAMSSLDRGQDLVLVLVALQ